MTTLLVTGGAGFIGSCFIRHILKQYPDYLIYNLDSLSYCGNLENLNDIKNNPNHKFIHGNICNKKLVRELVKESDYVVNFANLKSDIDAIYDNPLVLLVNLAIKLGIKSIALAGFDGYSGKIDGCYYSNYAKLLYDKSNVELRNEALKAFISSIKDKVDIKTITPSKYF